MKKWWIYGLLALILAGCASREAMETVADAPMEPAMAQVRQVLMGLPPEAAAPAVSSESGSLYLCEGYEIGVQTLQSGDLNATVEAVTGYALEDLTVIRREGEGARRYDLAWASAGETGDLVGRAAILDDGNYHYVLTVLGEAQGAYSHRDDWQRLLQSFRLGDQY